MSEFPTSKKAIEVSSDFADYYILEDVQSSYKGKIEEIIYHGDHARVRLNLLGNAEFILKVPNSSARLDIKRGNEINVGWNSHDARALDPKSI